MRSAEVEQGEVWEGRDVKEVNDKVRAEEVRGKEVGYVRGKG